MIPMTIPVVIVQPAGFDVYGRALPGKVINERCSILVFRDSSAHTTVRTDSSATHGGADERRYETKLLMSPKTKAAVGSRITVRGASMVVIEKRPRFSSLDKLDHFEVTCQNE